MLLYLRNGFCRADFANPINSRDLSEHLRWWILEQQQIGLTTVDYAFHFGHTNTSNDGWDINSIAHAMEMSPWCINHQTFYANSEAKGQQQMAELYDKTISPRLIHHNIHFIRYTKRCILLRDCNRDTFLFLT